MVSRASLSVVFAAERLLTGAGGAELAVLEWLAGLADRGHVRACFVADFSGRAVRAPAGVTLLPVPAPAASSYWAARRARREAVGRAVARTLAEQAAGVVVTQLHAAPAVVDAAHAADAPVVLVLPSYESLCKYAFDVGSRCRPSSRCRGCPAAAELDVAEARELFDARDAHERSLARADRLVAHSAAVARVCALWCGRTPAVIAPVSAPGPVLPARPTGHVLLAAVRWTDNKGLRLLGALCRGLGHRHVVVTEPGLPSALRVELEGLDHVQLVDASLATLLRDAGLLLVPSQFPEPFGRIAFEGLAAGVPTLASSVGGLPEFVPASQLVAPPQSAAAWLAAIRRLEGPDAWAAARRAGIAAARAVTSSGPLPRLEALLRETAAVAGRDRPSASD